MKLGRFFVTVTTLLCLSLLTVVSARHTVVHESTSEGLVHEGNAKLAEAQVLQRELAHKFNVVIGSETSATHAIKWNGFSKLQRLEVQSGIAAYLSLLNRVLQIDAQKNITIEHREQVVASRHSAEALQESIENFEKIYGQNFETKSSENGIVHEQASGEI